MSSPNIFVSCFTTDYEILQKSWDLKRSGMALTDKDQQRYDAQAGVLLAFESGNDVPICVAEQRCPFGIYDATDELLVCDAKNNEIVRYDPLNLAVNGVIKSPLFNDLHSITNDGGDLLVTSSGVDTVLRLNRSSEEITKLVSFFNPDTRKTTPLVMTEVDLGIDYSSMQIPTASQNTHLNYAIRMSDGTVWISLFHQNMVISYDEQNGTWSPKITGLKRPHSIFETTDYLYLADSGNGVVRIYKKQTLEQVDQIALDGWVQEIRPLSRTGNFDGFTAVNADTSCIDFFNARNEKTSEIRLPNSFRLASVVVRN